MPASCRALFLSCNKATHSLLWCCMPAQPACVEAAVHCLTTKQKLQHLRHTWSIPRHTAMDNWAALKSNPETQSQEHPIPAERRRQPRSLQLRGMPTCSIPIHTLMTSSLSHDEACMHLMSRRLIIWLVSLWSQRTTSWSAPSSPSALQQDTGWTHAACLHEAVAPYKQNPLCCPAHAPLHQEELRTLGP